MSVTTAADQQQRMIALLDRIRTGAAVARATTTDEAARDELDAALADLDAELAGDRPVPHRRAEVIARMEAVGALVPGCPGCQPAYGAENPASVMQPPHKASTRCESGKHPHCTCDTCF